MPWAENNPEAFFRKHAPKLVDSLSMKAMRAGVAAANSVLKGGKKPPTFKGSLEGYAVASGIATAKRVQAGIR